MSLNAAAIALVAGEISAQLVGSRVDRISSPTGFPRDLLLSCETSADAPPTVLRIVIEKERARLHLEPSPRFTKTPHPLAGTLATHLVGKTITGLRALPGERIVELDFTATPETDVPLRLVVEFFSPGNLLLLDAKATILLCAREKHGRRSLHQGEVYTQAPLPANPAPPDLPTWWESSAAPANEQVFRHYLPLDTRIIEDRRRREQLGALRRALAKAEGRKRALTTQLAQTAEAFQLRRWGELLKTNLKAIRPGQETLKVTDYFDPELPEVEIPLEPGKSPKEIMSSLFHQAKRLDKGRLVVQERLGQTTSLVAAAKEALDSFEAGTPIADLQALLQPLTRERLYKYPQPAPATPARGAKKQETKAAPGERYRRFLSSEGMTILVGRSSRQNDILTLRVARGNDHWLHVGGGSAGSHVVIRVPRGKNPAMATLLDAGHLAVYYSKARGRPKTDVIWTQRKWVRKIKGSPVGQVRVDRSRTLLVAWDEELFQELLQRSGEGEV